MPFICVLLKFSWTSNSMEENFNFNCTNSISQQNTNYNHNIWENGILTCSTELALKPNALSVPKWSCDSILAEVWVVIFLTSSISTVCLVICLASCSTWDFRSCKSLFVETPVNTSEPVRKFDSSGVHGVGRKEKVWVKYMSISKLIYCTTLG